MISLVNKEIVKVKVLLHVNYFILVVNKQNFIRQKKGLVNKKVLNYLQYNWSAAMFTTTGYDDYVCINKNKTKGIVLRKQGFFIVH